LFLLLPLPPLFANAILAVQKKIIIKKIRNFFMVDIPLDSGHLFRSISATHSGTFRPSIPEYFGHPKIQYNF